MMTVKLEALLNTATKTGFTGDSIKAKRNRYYIIKNDYFLELGAYKKSIKSTDMANIMRFSEDKLDLLNQITVYSDRYYPYGKVTVDNKDDKSRASMQVYLKERKLNCDNYNTPEGNAIHINHKNGIICDNSNENLEELERIENLVDRHLFTKKTQFEIRTEEAMSEMIDILNSNIELINCNGVLIKKNSKDYSRNPAMCSDEDVITVADFFQNWSKLHPRKDISDKYQIIKRTKYKTKK